jgi:hypothetical protein
MSMAKSALDMKAQQQKADLAIQQHTMRAADMQNRQQERRTAQQFKLSQPPRQGGPV